MLTMLRKTLFGSAILTALLVTPLQAQTLDELCTSEQCHDLVKGFERYAQHGNTHSMVFLALAYANGEVVEQDQARARMWIRESVRLRSPLGAYVKAQWRRQGFIFEQDEERAEWLIDRAIAGGFSVAMYDRAVRLLRDPEGMQSGADLLEEAADLGLPDARYLLALLLESGEVYEQDLVTAGLLYRELAVENFRDSRERLDTVIAQVERSSAEDVQTVVAQLRAYDDMEVITVYGRHGSFDDHLASINASVRERFAQRPTGTRLRRARPCEGEVGCRVLYNREWGDVGFTTLAGALGMPNGM